MSVASSSSSEISPSSSTDLEFKSEQEVAEKFEQLRQECRAINSKITELEHDRSEHNLVLKQLGDLEGDRRCFRMVNGVLVERTVNEVVPAVQTNRENLTEVIDRLNASLQTKEQLLLSLQTKYNIKMQGQNLLVEMPSSKDD